LILTIGNLKRNIFLPRSLSSLKVKGAKFEDNNLIVTFGQK